MHNSNQFDMDFAKRMAIASAMAAPLTFFVSGGAFMLFAFTFGPIIAALIAMAIAASLIGMIGHSLNLIDFPLADIFQEEQISQASWIDRKHRISMTGAALPLSFSASFLWSVKGAMTLSGSFPGLLWILSVPAGTLALTIISTEGAIEPKQTLYTSGKAFIVMMLIVIAL